MILLNEIEQAVGNEYLDSEPQELRLLSAFNKELASNLFSQPHANHISDLSE